MTPLSACRSCVSKLIDQQPAVPQLAGALAAAVANIESDDLFACGIKGDPDPLVSAFATNKTLHFIGLRLESQERHSTMDDWLQGRGKLLYPAHYQHALNYTNLLVTPSIPRSGYLPNSKTVERLVATAEEATKIARARILI